jgi:hypothetical protein
MKSGALGASFRSYASSRTMGCFKKPGKQTVAEAAAAAVAAGGSITPIEEETWQVETAAAPPPGAGWHVNRSGTTAEADWHMHAETSTVDTSYDKPADAPPSSRQPSSQRMEMPPHSDSEDHSEGSSGSLADPTTTWVEQHAARRGSTEGAARGPNAV